MFIHVIIIIILANIQKKEKKYYLFVSFLVVFVAFLLNPLLSAIKI
jgi:hypothetical protein